MDYSATIISGQVTATIIIVIVIVINSNSNSNNWQNERQECVQCLRTAILITLEKTKMTVRISEHAVFSIHYEVCYEIVKMKLLKCFFLGF